MPVVQAYDPEPTYPAVGAGVLAGWNAAAGDLPASGVLAVDGPQHLDWVALRCAPGPRSGRSGGAASTVHSGYRSSGVGAARTMAP